MKRLIIAVTLMLAVVGLGASWAGAALERGWEISSFDVDASIQPNSAVEVTETIIHKHEIKLTFGGFVAKALPFAVAHLVLALGYVLFLL